MTTKDILDIVLIPLAVVLLPLIWAFCASLFRRTQFRNLILREIEEIGPFPLDRSSLPSGNSWTDHHTQKRFLHKEIFEKPTENRDFILSLSPDLVYHVIQLWQSKDNHDQWLYMISQIKSQAYCSRRNKIQKVEDKWRSLMREYGVQV
jgi:hypothetical protein